MPHKHTRREKDESSYELPPSQVAKPLPVTTVSKKNSTASKPDNEGAVKKKKKKLKRKRIDGPADDVPRAFKRMMALTEGKRLRSGLDDGVAPPKKNKQAKNSAHTAALDDGTKEPAGGTRTGVKITDVSRALPTIRPGERFAEFAQRVDAELPLGGLVKKTVKNGKDPMGLKVWRTHKEMKMQKLYEEWRIQDAKIKERKAEEQDLAEERELEEVDTLGVSWKMAEFEEHGSGGGKKKQRKSKRGRVLGEAPDKEEDPWAVLNAKRGEVKTGIRAVVKAPPELKIPTNKLVRGAAVKTADVPKTAGSLRQREELAGIRDDVVASYRKLMSARRAVRLSVENRVSQ